MWHDVTWCDCVCVQIHVRSHPSVIQSDNVWQLSFPGPWPTASQASLDLTSRCRDMPRQKWKKMVCLREFEEFQGVSMFDMLRICWETWFVWFCMFLYVACYDCYDFRCSRFHCCLCFLCGGFWGLFLANKNTVDVCIFRICSGEHFAGSCFSDLAMRFIMPLISSVRMPSLKCPEVSIAFKPEFGSVSSEHLTTHSLGSSDAIARSSHCDSVSLLHQRHQNIT